MRIVSTNSDVSHVGEHEAVGDGIFDVPDEVGAHLLAFPGWRAPTEDELDDNEPADEDQDDDEDQDGEKPDLTKPATRRTRHRKP